MKNKILVTGGAGYVGAILVPLLIRQGYSVKVLDLMIYGDTFSNNPQINLRHLEIIKGDIRNSKTVKSALKDVSSVIHLACISNDPSFDLNPRLGISINFSATEPLVLLARSAGVERFIYASSSSVYGIKKEKNVHEEMRLAPLTDYSKCKAKSEEIILKYKTMDFCSTVVRPATICGYSPRQRLDVIVNILTNFAYHKRFIQVFGGNQLRPNIHIKDMCETYLKLLMAPINKISGQVFNVGFENHSVIDLAKIVQRAVGDDVTIERLSSNDNRSYHISSQKIKNSIGFFPQFTIEDAVKDLVAAFNKNQLPYSFKDKRFFNIQMMKDLNLKLMIHSTG